MDDGRPLRASDVVFTFDTLKARGAPFYRQAFSPLAVIAESDDRIVFINDRLGDRDVLRRISTIRFTPSTSGATIPEQAATICQSDRDPIG